MPRHRTLDELQAMALDHAEFMLFGDANGEILPTFWIQFDDKPGEMIVTSWSDEAEKLAVVEMIRGKLKNPKARSYAFVSEVWVARGVSQLPPSQNPDRSEAVMAHAFDRNGKGGIKVHNIKRDDKGVVVALDEDKTWRWFDGRMYNLFHDGRMQHGVVRRSMANQDAATTRTPLNACLDCGRLIDAGSPANPDDPAKPSPGDIAICLHCAHVMIYADDLTVRAPTDAEVIEIAGDPDMVRAVNAISEFNKRERAG